MTVLAGMSPYDLIDADLESMTAKAASLRDDGHGSIVSYSPKVFIPLTHLCRDVCHYCTFAKAPRQLRSPFLRPDEVIGIARCSTKPVSFLT